MNIFDCGCESRKEVMQQDDWALDLAILVVLGVSLAALYVGMKAGGIVE